ncbi:MAG: hypothetical protein ACXVCY_12520 [Pseudobdellovibrionaceae bacterium]
MNLRTFFIAYLFFMGISTSFAASVTAAKGNQVLINLDGDSMIEGDEFYLLNPATGKRAAIIRVKQIKGQKALAELLKGKADIGFTLQAKGSSAISKDVSASSPAEGAVESLHVLKSSYGFTGGYLMNSMSADVSYKDGFGVTQKSSVSMSGSGFSVGGFYDYAFSSDLVARGAANIEQFNVSGTASAAGCSSSTNCDAKINYLSLYALGKWYLLQGGYRLWMGGGAGYLLALSKSSTALNESQISTNQVFTASIGMDIQRGRKNYIPVNIEYTVFPDSPTVKANMIVIKAGWAWNL